MHTRAKFYVTGVTLLPGQDAGVKVNLSAVSRGDRNATWAKATPMGSMEMTINNPVAAQAWEDFMQAARRTGKSPELFIDIYPSEDGWPGDGHLFRLADIEEGISGHGMCGECSMPKDGFITQYDRALGKTVDTETPYHPNG